MNRQNKGLLVLLFLVMAITTCGVLSAMACGHGFYLEPMLACLAVVPSPLLFVIAVLGLFLLLEEAGNRASSVEYSFSEFTRFARFHSGRHRLIQQQVFLL